ncbi:MAG: hypothetical protein Q8P20_08685 [bacterium]|nr:hypothetical protein [bacterium]
MRKTIYIIFGIVVFLFALCIFPGNSRAAYYATDIVYLREQGVQISDNAIFLASYETQSERCLHGVCMIGQQFYPVKIYMLKDDSTMIYSEYVYQHPYTGDNDDGNAKDVWNAQIKSDYLVYLSENGDPYISFDPGPSIDIGDSDNKIGDDRSYKLDLITSQYSLMSEANRNDSNDVEDSQDLVTTVLIIWHTFFGVVMLIGALMIFFGARGIKKNKVAINSLAQQNQGLKPSSSVGIILIILGLIVFFVGTVANLLPYFTACCS